MSAASQAQVDALEIPVRLAPRSRPAQVHSALMITSSTTTTMAHIKTSETTSLDLSFTLHTMPYQIHRLASRAARNRTLNAKQRHFVAQAVDLVEHEYGELRILVSLMGLNELFMTDAMGKQVSECQSRLLAGMRRLRKLVRDGGIAS